MTYGKGLREEEKKGRYLERLLALPCSSFQVDDLSEAVRD